MFVAAARRNKSLEMYHTELMGSRRQDDKQVCENTTTVSFVLNECGVPVFSFNVMICVDQVTVEERSQKQHPKKNVFSSGRIPDPKS